MTRTMTASRGFRWTQRTLETFAKCAAIQRYAAPWRVNSSRGLQHVLWAWVLGMASPFAVAAAAEPPRVELAREGRAALAITVGSEASAEVQETAKELADYLDRISGATFRVEPGAGGAGIVLGRPADFSELPFEVQFGEGAYDREEYLLRTHAGALYLLGASDLAVSHAVWDLLHRLGYRQFFPGETWEIVPERPTLVVALDDRQRPAFHARRIWYNWGLWGYNNEPYKDWCRRNRMAKGFDLNSGHAYEAIIAANRAAFEEHPEYFALVNGERKLRPDAKFCVSNPGLRQLVVDHVVRSFQANPELDSVSLDPSDGGGWCECADCAKLGSVSNRVVTLANEAAAAANGLGLGAKAIGMYAYNQHAAPPTIPVHPQVIPSATTAFIGGGLTFDQVMEGWQKQNASMGVYDYLSVVDWDWNLPRGGSASRLKHIAEFLPRVHKQGARFYDAESGDCWGPCGLGYYLASRVLWDVNEGQNAAAIVDDFLVKSFGDAQEPMRGFYRLINEETQRRPPSDLVGRMYRFLDQARQATNDPDVHKRIDDLTLFTRHAELYYGFAAGKESRETVVRHVYRMRTTMMVHSYGLWARLLTQQAALDPQHPLKDDRPFEAAEIATILAEGIAGNQPVEPGFEGVEYSQKLVPAAERLQLPDVAEESFPTAAQDHQRYHIWLPEGAESLDLEITVTKLWENRSPKISLFSPQEVHLNAVAVDESYKPDGKTYEIRLPTPYAGLHRVETVDGGDYTRIVWPADVPVTIESGIDTPGVTSHFRGEWSLYFYVPKGTKFVGGWSSRIANWAPRPAGQLLDPAGNVALDFGKTDEGWFKVPVGPGQDGRLWKFEKSHGQRLLMTVPPFLARRAQDLLLPVEVVEADSGK